MKIINIKSGDPYDLYIGRANKWKNLPQSKWHNPFPMKNESERGEVLRKFEEYLNTRQDLLESLHELDGKVLACWCAPHKRCHGDILKEYRDKQKKS